MAWLSDARTPDGMRIYAIGDVHGCLEALRGVHRAIEADLAARPGADWRIIHVGDYVDRGPDSRGVVDLLAERMAGEPRMLCLRGNHDEMFLNGLGGDAHNRELWLANGGLETLESYGLSLADYIDALRAGGVTEDVIPQAHRDFLDGLPHSARFGDYYFVHAGIEPGRALDSQESGAQLWIRGPFLESEQEFEAVIIHGHTPVGEVDIRPNRLGIDTGAVFGGSLTCLVLDGAGKGVLTSAGVTPLTMPEPYGEGEAAGASDTARPTMLGRILRGLARRG